MPNCCSMMPWQHCLDMLHASLSNLVAISHGHLIQHVTSVSTAFRQIEKYLHAIDVDCMHCWEQIRRAVHICYRQASKQAIVK